MESDTPLPLSDYITHFKAIFRMGKSLMGKVTFVFVVTPVLNNISGIHYFENIFHPRIRCIGYRFSLDRTIKLANLRIYYLYLKQFLIFTVNMSKTTTSNSKEKLVRITTVTYAKKQQDIMNFGN